MTLGGPPRQQRAAIVTGGGRGIGRAAALALGRAGQHVCVVDPGVELDGSGGRPDVAEAVAQEIVAAGGQAMPTTIDARTSSGAAELVATATAWAGTEPTVLVHAAGTLRDGMAHKATDADWAEILGSHLHVAIELTRAMLPAIRTRGWGRLVYVGGAAGLVGSVGQAAYNVAKAGLFGLTRAIALELASRDACVNYLAPFAFTRMTESIPPATDALRSYLDTAPQATPDDVAPLIAWLCSDDARGLTGQVLGARGAKLELWSQPRPVTAAAERTGFDAASLAQARTDFDRHLTPLESEFDLFGDAPVPVEREQEQEQVAAAGGPTQKDNHQ